MEMGIPVSWRDANLSDLSLPADFAIFNQPAEAHKPIDDEVNVALY